MAPVANAQLLAEGIPGAELHVVADAGHAVPLEHPAASAALLVEWVRRHALVEPAAPRRLSVGGERLTRPFSLQAGALRNTRDAVASLAHGFTGQRELSSDPEHRRFPHPWKNIAAQNTQSTGRGTSIARTRKTATPGRASRTAASQSPSSA